MIVVVGEETSEGRGVRGEGVGGGRRGWYWSIACVVTVYIASGARHFDPSMEHGKTTAKVYFVRVYRTLRFAGSTASYARSQGRKKRTAIHDYRCNLTTSKCQELLRVRARKHFFLVGRAEVDVFVRFENTASCKNVRRHAGPRELCLLAFVVEL